MVQILNSIEELLENVLTSVVSSDNNTLVPDSTNSSMVIVEMASLALPATKALLLIQRLCVCLENI